MYAYTVEPLYVKSGQDVIAADFYRPQNVQKPAVILMAHGFAALRQFKLVYYAQKFAQAGYAVVLFDYRYWGGSTGRPRELVSLKDQLQDWNTMIQHVSERNSIDSHRIVLWGTGLSGGYVLSLAAALNNLQAVMVQVPFVDGTDIAKRYPLQYLPKVLKLSSQDYMGAKVGLKPKTLAVANLASLCFFPGADAYAGYQSIVHPDYYWSGEVPARVFFHLMRYRPIQDVAKINIPVLLIAAQQDKLMSIESSRQTAANMASFVEYHEWEMGHFDIYQTAWLEKSLMTQLEFLQRQMGVG